METAESPEYAALPKKCSFGLRKEMFAHGFLPVISVLFVRGQTGGAVRDTRGDL
jgi:hypothetical protein